MGENCIYMHLRRGSSVCVKNGKETITQRYAFGESVAFRGLQARRRGGSRGSNEPPLEVNNGGLQTQTVDFQLLANSGEWKTNFECCSF